MKDETSRHAEYRRVMSSLSLVPRNTARKLFAHLHFLHTMSHANKMGAENLASVWAPTIMPTALVITRESIYLSNSLQENQLIYIFFKLIITTFIFLKYLKILVHIGAHSSQMDNVHFFDLN